MNVKWIFTAFLFGFSLCAFSQETTWDLDIKITLSEDVQNSVRSKGRLFIFLNKNLNVEPRRLTWPSLGNYIFAKNLEDLDAGGELIISHSHDFIKTTDWTLDNIPEGDYSFQVLWDQDTEESRINAPGNIYSIKQKIELNGSQTVEVILSDIIPPRELSDHPLVREIHFKSDTLSKWWSKPVYLNASVLLPNNYKKGTSASYPIRYNVAGYGGRYTRINHLADNKGFMDWWQSDEAPQIINVFLDGEGPFGDSYQMDSDNSGPYGYALIHELMPHIESNYRGTQTARMRFVDGCSTGGWVSLGLQLYYPESFNGVFSYSPDAIEFENYQLINIYKDENAYTNEYGYLRPVARTVDGEPMIPLKDFIQYENVLGSSNTYLNSGGQFSAHTALYSPKGSNGLPKPLFDPVSGAIDQAVAAYWKKYDFKIYAKENWEKLGPKVQGKIFIWMGDMDHFYLNPATRAFDKFLQSTENPKSDAEIIFTPMAGHCSQYSQREVLTKMWDRVKKIEGKD
jgi:enterochelin esterase-like enzyme